MFIPILLFLCGLLLLIKGGDWFVDGAVGVSHRFHVPELIIGATVVSIGTTLPEVMVSAGAAMSEHGDIAYGNAIGSVICNTALIAALTIAIRPSGTNKKTLAVPVVFFFAAAIIYGIAAYVTGSFSRLIGILLLSIFLIYMVYSVLSAKKHPDEQLAVTDTTPFAKNVALLVIGAALIALGAKLLVDNGTKIAELLGVPESVIALTFVALGTSLPELVTAITSLAKGHSSLSLGNIVGANLFNLVLVSGLSITINPFSLPIEKQFLGHNASLIVDMPVMFLVMAIMTVPALCRGKLSRVQGILLLAVYAAFCAFQFIF